MARIPSYMEKARRASLEGLSHKSPADAIAAGERTVTEWIGALDKARADAGLGLEGAQQVRPAKLDELVDEDDT